MKLSLINWLMEYENIGLCINVIKIKLYVRPQLVESLAVVCFY